MQVAYLDGVHALYSAAAPSPTNTPVRRLLISREHRALKARLQEVNDMIDLCQESVVAMGDDAGVSRRIGFSLNSPAP